MKVTPTGEYGINAHIIIAVTTEELSVLQMAMKHYVQQFGNPDPDYPKLAAYAERIRRVYDALVNWGKGKE